MINKKIKDLDLEIQAWQDKAEKLGDRISESGGSDDRQKLKKQKEGLLISAVIDRQPEAERKLAEINRRLLEIDQLTRDRSEALEAARMKIASLERDKAELHKKELVEKLKVKAGEKLEVSEKIENLINELAENVEQYLKQGRDMYVTAQDLGKAQARLLGKNTVFGYMCHKIQKFFPHDLPRADVDHRRPLSEMDQKFLESFIKNLNLGGSQNEKEKT